MHIVLDPSDTRTLPVRIAEAIRNQVAAGILYPGEPAKRAAPDGEARARP